MEFYTLDNLLRRKSIFDSFESLAWTERVSSYGDFEMVIKSTPETRAALQAGVRTTISGSKRVMEIKTVQDTIDSEGKAALKIEGKDLVRMLDDRVATNSTTTDGVWTITDQPADIARYMFDQICRVGVPLVSDKIPFLVVGTIYPASTIPEPSETITWSQKRDTLYNAIKDLADLYSLGFRLVRNYDLSELYFDIYTGFNRTSSQIILPPVVFSRELDTLQNSMRFKTTEENKNVAYVFSAAGSRVVYAPGVDPSISGFDRKVLVVNSSLSAGTPGWQALLDQEGLKELSYHKGFEAFDGEVNQNSAYKYEIDYYLGDLVEMRDIEGQISTMRVTEQIFVQDKEGERSYPTLTAV